MMGKCPEKMGLSFSSKIFESFREFSNAEQSDKTMMSIKKRKYLTWNWFDASNQRAEPWRTVISKLCRRTNLNTTYC